MAIKKELKGDIPSTERNASEPQRLLQFFKSLRGFRTLKFGVVSVPAASEEQGRAGLAKLTNDVLHRPNLCYLLNKTMTKLLPSGTNRQELSKIPKDDSWWSLCVNRKDASDRVIQVTSTPMYVFLVADRWQRHHEYGQSRQIFHVEDTLKSPVLNDASKIPVYLPAGVAWGIMPACDVENGKPVEKAGDNYVITLSAPSCRGILGAEDLKKLKDVGFNLSDPHGPNGWTKVVQKSHSESDVPKTTLVECANAYLSRTEKELLPGKEFREQEKAEEEERRKQRKRKAEMYCEFCKCPRCEKKRPRTQSHASPQK